MIELRLAHRHPGSGFAVDVDLRLPARGVSALFGRSGAGKSTLIAAAAGLLRPQQGRIAVAGRLHLDTAQGLDLAPEQRRVGCVFQDARLFPHLSVAGNLRYGLRRSAGPARIGWDTVVGVLGLEGLLARRPHQLSGGEKQRVALGRALLRQPDWLLMDEPLAALDAPRKAEVLPMLEGLVAEFALPVLYVSHAIDEVTRLAEHLVLLSAGRAVASGPLTELMADPALAPLVGRFEAGAVLDCTVAGHDPAWGLSSLRFADGLLRVPQLDAPPGSRLRVRIRARDVALALSEPADVSLSNRLPGRVASLSPREGPYVDVAVDLGRSSLRALITRESAARLALAPGRPVWALIKSVALDGRSVGFQRRGRDGPPPGGEAGPGGEGGGGPTP